MVVFVYCRHHPQMDAIYLYILLHFQDPNEDITDVVSPEISPPTTPNPAFNCSSTTRPVKRKILMCEDALNVTENGLSYTNADRFDLAAKTWAAKLRELDSNQRIHAEKLINDVLYEAELGNLNRHCKIWIQPALHILQPTLPSRAE